MEPDLEVSRDIKASASDVFAAITDIERMAEMSPENTANTWHEGFDTVALGAEWTGHNRNGDNEWSTQSKVTELVADELFVFDCLSRGFVFATWSYRIEATESGCRVTESYQDLRPQTSMERSASISGVTDRVAHNKAGMETTLERLAAAVESGE